VSRDFLDTNVLVYADDLDAGERREVARAIVRRAVQTREAVLSTQVLQEYFVIATRKLGVDVVAARRKVELLSTLEIVRIEAAMILEAIDLTRLHSISFWDALIVRAASAAGCRRLITEDLQEGALLAGVTVTNPFTSVLDH
jgi:predicted nucleic acid-binding protein